MHIGEEPEAEHLDNGIPRCPTEEREPREPPSTPGGASKEEPSPPPLHLPPRDGRKHCAQRGGVHGDVPEDRENVCGGEQREEVDDGRRVAPGQVEQAELVAPRHSGLRRRRLVVDGEEEGGARGGDRVGEWHGVGFGRQGVGCE